MFALDIFGYIVALNRGFNMFVAYSSRHHRLAHACHHLVFERSVKSYPWLRQWNPGCWIVTLFRFQHGPQYYIWWTGSTVIRYLEIYCVIIIHDRRDILDTLMLDVDFELTDVRYVPYPKPCRHLSKLYDCRRVAPKVAHMGFVFTKVGV